MMFKKIKEYFEDWTTFEKYWVSIFFIVTIYLFFAWHDTWIGLVASLTGMACVVLVAKGKISNYYFGFVNIFAYSYVAFQNQYYGEVMLNLGFFLPAQFFGLYFWFKHKKKNTKDDVLVNKISIKEKIGWFVVSIVSLILYGLWLKNLGNTLPFFDSATNVFSIIATILMIKRVSEQWLLWIAVDVISIWMWVYTLIQGGNDVTIAVMWVAYLVNAIYGYYNWRKLEIRRNDR